MIRIVLLGRTGNNLFQYALGRMLATKHGVPLILDGSWFNEDGWREVSHFLRLPLNAHVVRRCSLGARALRKVTGKHYWEYLGVPILREDSADQSFDQRFHNAPADCMLFGYFQSPLYFADIHTELRIEINSLFNRFVPSKTEFRESISYPNSVAVHVRRGDYLTHPAFRVCDSDYYRKSMDLMRQRIPDTRFFIFSDDPNWCRSEFRGKDEFVVDSEEMASNPLHDLRLMSLASHHVIANSSYSWWAAWLANCPGQIVTMPDRWYSEGLVAPIHEKNPGNWTVI